MHIWFGDAPINTNAGHGRCSGFNVLLRRRVPSDQLMHRPEHGVVASASHLQYANQTQSWSSFAGELAIGWFVAARSTELGIILPHEMHSASAPPGAGRK